MAGSSGISPRKLMAMGKKPAKKQGVKKRGMGGGVAKKAGVRKMNRGGPMKPVMRRGGSGKKKT